MSSRSDASSRPIFVILGATGGIGSALTRRMASHTTRLVLGARNRDRLESLAQEVGAEAKIVDATRFEEVERLLLNTREQYGAISGVACCVGSILLKPAHSTSEEEFSGVITSNLTAAFATVRAAGRALSEHGGSVVLCSSAAARMGLPNHEAIAAAKAGIIGLVLSAAATYAPRGIRFNAVAPGLVRTPLTARLTGNEATLRTSVSMHPLGRIGEPEDVAAALEWLLMPTSSWVTGQVIGVDGGLADLKLRG